LSTGFQLIDFLFQDLLSKADRQDFHSLTFTKPSGRFYRQQTHLTRPCPKLVESIRSSNPVFVFSFNLQLDFHVVMSEDFRSKYAT